MNLVNMYAQARRRRREPGALLPTGNILPGSLPERAIADGIQGEGPDDLGPDLENSRSGSLVPWACLLRDGSSYRPIGSLRLVVRQRGSDVCVWLQTRPWMDIVSLSWLLTQFL